jgi:UDPglucose--hexose-1-phosphate uridylyltransferase
LPVYDPDCYLCPGNTRKSGHRNPDYTATYVFDNDFRALLDDVPSPPTSDHPLLHLEGVEGTNRVLCFSPRHDLTLARMDVADIRRVVDLWGDETADLGRTYRWVQMFENRGEAMGASNPHPHGQVWAQKSLPNEAVTEDYHQREYADGDPAARRSLLLDYALLESDRGERTVVENDDWIVVVPYWAFWPYETLVLPKFRVQRMPELPPLQRDSLAEALKRLLVKYDNLFKTSFPYSMGWHGAPFASGDLGYWQLHAHYYPPLLRSATVRKFMVGYELLSEAQRDLTAERAAETLRGLPEIHYREDKDNG